MTRMLALLLLVAIGHASPALAQSAARSPLLGAWEVELERLPIPPEARPKRVTITYSDAGGGKWRTHVDIFGQDGSESHAVSTYALDGSAAAVSGSPEADVTAATLPAPDTLVVALGKGGIPASTRIYAAAPDGKTMIETAVYFGDDGKPVMRTNYFRRVW